MGSSKTSGIVVYLVSKAVIVLYVANDTKQTFAKVSDENFSIDGNIWMFLK